LYQNIMLVVHWFQCTQTVFKINTIIYRNISYLHQHALMNFITWLFYIPPQSSTNNKLSSCFEYRGLMIVSKYYVGGGLWRLLNINLLIMMTLWRHNAPNFTERYIFWKFVYITIKLVNCCYSMSSIIF
jgi:hypothetical protein